MLAPHPGHFLSQLTLLAGKFISVSLILQLLLLDVTLAQGRGLPLELLDFGLQLPDLLDQICVQFLLQLGILADLLGKLEQLLLKIFPGGLAIPDHLLVLRNVFLQVVEDL